MPHPSNATDYELAVNDGVAFDPSLKTAVASIYGFKQAATLIDSTEPFIIWELGLGGIEPFFATAELAIAAGVPWTRMKGTPGAIVTSFAWIDYDTITIDDNRVRRRCWGRGQVDMGEMPIPNEMTRLNDAEFLADLSLPARSVFFRGYYGWNIPAAETSYQKTSQSIIGDSSGTRIDGNGVKWSHGREHVVSSVATGLFESVFDFDPLTEKPGWGKYPWSTAGLSWTSIANPGAFKSSVLEGEMVYIRFTDANRDVIGYALANKVITKTFPDTDHVDVTYEFRTDFGDGDEKQCAFVKLVFLAEPAIGVKPYKKWLSEAEIVTNDFNGDPVAYDPLNDQTASGGEAAVSFQFLKTSRENLKFTVTL